MKRDFSVLGLSPIGERVTQPVALIWHFSYTLVSADEWVEVPGQPHNRIYFTLLKYLGTGFAVCLFY